MLDFGFYLMDCMEGMKQFPDKFFDLAICDPPYFSGPEKREHYGRKQSPIGVQRNYKPSAKWHVPGKEYFEELLRVSKNQIIWNKCNGDSSFSDCEIAYCSMHDSVRLFRYMWNGMMQGKSIAEGHIQQGNKKLNEKRIHPTQKPINLYRWIAQKYIEKGWKVLDTHVGSASSLIAYEEYRIDYVGFEKDRYYYDLANKRLQENRAQLTLFDFGIACQEDSRKEVGRK